MSNVHCFDGRIAAAPVLTGAGERAVCKFTAIRNEYAGKDQNEEAMERTVAIQFTAFRARAEAIARNFMKGDQIILTARIENNNWTDKDQVEHYGFNFVVTDFGFGAPGEEKRKQLEAQKQ